MLEIRNQIKKIAELFGGLIIAGLVMMILVRNRSLFFEESRLRSVTAVVPFESSRAVVFYVMIALVMLTVLTRIAKYVIYSHKLVTLKENHFLKMPAAAIGFVLNSVLSFYVVEIVNNYYIADMKERYVLLGIGITAVIYLIFAALTNSFSVGMTAGNVFFLLWAAANYFVQQFRGIPLQWVDFSSAKTAMSVAGNYRYQPNWQMCAACAVTYAVCCIWSDLCIYHNFRTLIGKIMSRITGAAVLVLFCLTLLKSNFLFDQGIWLRDWQPWYTYRLFGMEAGFFAFANASFPKAPDGYSADRVKQIENSVEIVKEVSAADTPENIICIMNESFTDLSIYPNFEADTELTPFVDNLTENTQSGTLLVSVKGGTTANTEYEFLTGNSCVLSPTTVVYNSFIKQDQYSIVRTLKEQGYKTVAMHPYGRFGWNRNTVYPKMGFDEFLNQSNYFAGAEKVRGFVSDRGNYQAIIDYVENKEEGEKLFIFNITMQNHSSYKNEQFESTVDVLGFNGVNEGQAEQYCSLIRMSDEAIEELISYFSASDEKTMICFFGDHQPEIGDDFWQYCCGENMDSLTFGEQQLQYETPWLIWTNYDSDEKQDVMMSANYLSSYLLEAAGLGGTGYNKFLLDQSELIPAMNSYGYYGNDQQFHEWDTDEAGADESNQLNDYKCLIYNELTAGNSRNEDFYAYSG